MVGRRQPEQSHGSVFDGNFIWIPFSTTTPAPPCAPTAYTPLCVAQEHVSSVGFGWRNCCQFSGTAGRPSSGRNTAGCSSWKDRTDSNKIAARYGGGGGRYIGRGVCRRERSDRIPCGSSRRSIASVEETNRPHAGEVLSLVESLDDCGKMKWAKVYGRCIL